MVRTQTGLVIFGVFLVSATLHADTRLEGAASGTNTVDKNEKKETAKETKVVDTSSLSTDQMKKGAEKFVIVLNGNLDHAQTSQARARKTNDILKLNCVNDGLLVTKQLVNSGDTAKAKFDKAVAANDRPEQIAQYNNLSTVAASCDESKQGIDGCIGTSQVTVTAKDGSQITVISPHIRDNITTECNELGLQACLAQLTLEYTAHASPFTP